MADSRVEKWRKWIDGRIFQEFAMMNLHRDTYQHVQRIVDENDRLPDSYFLEFLQDHYASVQAMAIRRQADTDPRVVSLGRLMAEISEEAERLTREEFVALWSDETKCVGEQAFDDLAGSDGTHLDPSIPTKDCSDLAASSEKVTAYVDQYLAHADAKPRGDLPTYADLDVAVDLMGDLFKKYANLLTAGSYATLVPTLQEGDWLAIFRQPWIRPDGSARVKQRA